ncbi:MAG: glycosyltransferase, group 1 family protein, partial [Mucilaginibacter sp.]|nr:glycosyltransferase, group 1 family protein [Mucilaginibacter sp.]
MKKILFFNILGIGHDTGANTYNKEVKNYFKKNADKFDFYFVDLNFDAFTEFELKKENLVNYINIPIPILTNKPKEQCIQDPVFASIVADLLNQHIEVDKKTVVHINWIDLTTIAKALKKISTCKIILTRHLIPSRSLLTSNYPAFFSTYNYFVDQYSIEFLFKEKQYYGDIDQFIVVTECSKRELQNNFNIKKSKIKVIKNGVSDTALSTNQITRAALRNQYNFKFDEKLIVYIGRNEKSLGLFWLIKAFKLLVRDGLDVRLIIVGNLDLTNVLRDNFDIVSKITTTGFIDQQKLFDLFKLSDIGVVPSAYEQCSYVAIEMMRHNLLVLSSNVDGLGEMIKDKKNGLTFNVDFHKDGVKADITELYEKMKYSLDPLN